MSNGSKASRINDAFALPNTRGEISSVRELQIRNGIIQLMIASEGKRFDTE